MSPSFEAAAIEDAEGVSRFAAALYGGPVGAARGVLQVVAVAEREGARHVMRIGEHSPRSDTDFFALNFARARVEAILVSGAVLRAEPELRYELGGPGRAGEALGMWRRALGLEAPPWLLVLTRGDVPLDHPALRSWAKPIVLSTREAAARMRAEAACEVLGMEAPSPRAALALLRARGVRSIRSRRARASPSRSTSPRARSTS